MSLMVDAAGRAPLVFNGGSEKVNIFYWMTYVVGASAIDVY